MANTSEIRLAGQDGMTGWAILGGIGAIGALLVFWITYNGAAARAAFEQQRNDEIAIESRAACEKWGIPAGAQKHTDCIADLKVIRERHEKRISDDLGMM
jgi:hypothetical protein